MTVFNFLLLVYCYKFSLEEKCLIHKVVAIFDLQVSEGGQALLSLDHIEISDPDTLLSQLTVVVETQPGFGVLKNMAQGTLDIFIKICFSLL